jgi:hypothetical protein
MRQLVRVIDNGTFCPGFQSIPKYVCSDLAAGGDGLWTSNAAQKSEPRVQQDLSVLNRNAAISSECPRVKPPALPTGAYDSSGFHDSPVVGHPSRSSQPEHRLQPTTIRIHTGRQRIWNAMPR